MEAPCPQQSLPDAIALAGPTLPTPSVSIRWESLATGDLSHAAFLGTVHPTEIKNYNNDPKGQVNRILSMNWGFKSRPHRH